MILDLRKRAMARLEKGESVRSIAATLEVAPSSVVKWSQRQRTTGSCAPKKMVGHKPYVLKDKDRDYIRARFKAKADTTIRGLQAELSERGTQASYGAIWNFIRGDGLSFKKNRHRR